MTTTQQLKLIIVALLVALAGTIYYYSLKDADVIVDDSVCMDFKEFKPNTLSTGLVSDLTANYRNNQLLEINKKMPVTDPDAHSIWFDLDTIKKFIYHIEKNVEKNSTNNERLGLRMYYAAYPNQGEFSKRGNEDLKDLDKDPITRKYGFKHTLVMIPTINRPTGNVDFNPMDKDTYDGYISMEKNIEVENSTEMKAAYQVAGYKPMAIMPDSRVSAKNHGSLIPPANTNVEGF